MVTIGRDEGNDIVIVNPQVSRSHATLTLRDGVWTLISIGRHGTIVNDCLVTEFGLRHQTVFQLGNGGPLLRFDIGLPEQRRSETLDNIDEDTIAMLSIDNSRKLQEVDQLAGTDLFRELMETSRKLRQANGESMPGA